MLLSSYAIICGSKVPPIGFINHETLQRNRLPIQFASEGIEPVYRVLVNAVKKSPETICKVNALAGPNKSVV